MVVLVKGFAPSLPPSTTFNLHEGDVAEGRVYSAELRVLTEKHVLDARVSLI